MSANYLFNRDLIGTRRAAARARIDELQAGASSSYTGPYSAEVLRVREIGDLFAQLATLSQVLRASDFVDCGDASVLDQNQRVADSSCLIGLPVSFDLFARTPLFAFFGQVSTGGTSAPALLFQYRAPCGAVLCSVDLRYGINYGFAAAHGTELDAPLAENALWSHLVRPHTIGLNELALWPVSIRLPRSGHSAQGLDMATHKGILSAFVAWYATYVPQQDGFVDWQDARVGNISRLTWTEWWADPV